jgi:hypothetical protein
MFSEGWGFILTREAVTHHHYQSIHACLQCNAHLLQEAAGSLHGTYFCKLQIHFQSLDMINCGLWMNDRA